MKNYFKMFAAVLALVLLPSLAFGQQFTLTQTTASAKIDYNTTSFSLASVTGITGFSTGNTIDLYIDRELMQVVSVNTAAKSVSVLRGMSGTQAAAHASGVMVLSGNPNAFIAYDPEGVCSITNPRNAAEAVPAQPTINIKNGNQWLCSAAISTTVGGTGTWVPGFGNPGNSGTPVTITKLVASTAGLITPSGPLFHVNGTSAITGFNIPTGCNATTVGGCSFTIIPDAAFTWTTANNIAVAGTAVANLLITFTWDPANSKFVQMQSK